MVNYLTQKEKIKSLISCKQILLRKLNYIIEFKSDKL